MRCTRLLVVVVVALLLFATGTAHGRKTAKEWREYASSSRVDDDDAAVNDNDNDDEIRNEDDPHVILATFADNIPRADKLALARKWTGQLWQFAGVRAEMAPYSLHDDNDDDNWVLTTNTKTKLDTLWRFFKRRIVEMPQLVKLDCFSTSRTLWNVPLHQAKHDAEQQAQEL